VPAFHALQVNVLTKTMQRASGGRLTNSHKMSLKIFAKSLQFPCFSPQDLRLEQVEGLGCQEAPVVVMGLGNIL